MNPGETVGREYASMSLGTNMHSARTVTDLGQELPRQPYEPLPDMQVPRMFPPMALAAFNLRAMHLHEDARYTPQSKEIGQETSSSSTNVDLEEYCNATIHPVTGKHITNYIKLKKDLTTTDV